MNRAELQQAVLEAQAQIQAQAQAALAERMTTLCIRRCVPAPTDKLADKQHRCLDMCTQSFVEGFGVAVSWVGRRELARARARARRPRTRAQQRYAAQRPDVARRPTRSATVLRSRKLTARPSPRTPPPQSETLASIAKKQAGAASHE